MTRWKNFGRLAWMETTQAPTLLTISSKTALSWHCHQERRQYGGAYFFLATGLAATAAVFFAVAVFAATVFCLVFFCVDFGDLSPI